MDVAWFLIQHGADTTKDRRGSTPLHLLSENGDVLAWLSQLCDHSIVDFAQLLVDYGADVSAKNNSGLPPLHWASRCGDMDLARFLVERGADVSAKDNSGSTPLHWASGCGDIDLARFLVEHGANVSARDEWGSTPLHRAQQCGHMDLAQVLIQHGANATPQMQQPICIIT